MRKILLLSIVTCFGILYIGLKLNEPKEVQAQSHTVRVCNQLNPPTCVNVTFDGTTLQIPSILNITGPFKVGSTTVIDTSRNGTFANLTFNGNTPATKGVNTGSSTANITSTSSSSTSCTTTCPICTTGCTCTTSCSTGTSTTSTDSGHVHLQN